MPPPMDIFGPSKRPGEPVTTGAALGPGHGPTNVMDTSPLATAIAIVEAWPSEGGRALVEWLRRQAPQQQAPPPQAPPPQVY